jgi:trans-aconitate methyltransferase
MTEASERLVWAVETLAVEPADHVLEIGCGHGVAVSLICERLTGGKITAIDRSQTMVDMARRRNRAHVSSGKAVFQVVALEQADFGGERFNKIFAFHVNLFWKQPARALGIVRGLLTPGGAVYLFHQLPAWKETGETRAFSERAADTLRSNGFSVREILAKDLKPTPAVCLVAEASAIAPG